MDEDLTASFSRVSAFEWDDNKRRQNIVKHGIDFADATQVFGDPKQYTYRSQGRSAEDRYVSVGLAGGALVYPVHVMTRKSFGLMTRKLSVTESQRSAQFRGTFSRRKLSVASANWAQVA
jgi:uncharacterized protein